MCTPTSGGKKQPLNLSVYNVQATNIPPKETLVYTKQTQTTSTGGGNGDGAYCPGAGIWLGSTVTTIHSLTPSFATVTVLILGLVVKCVWLPCAPVSPTPSPSAGGAVYISVPLTLSVHVCAPNSPFLSGASLHRCMLTLFPRFVPHQVPPTRVPPSREKNKDANRNHNP